MIILGVDTSCEQASCAIYSENDIQERRSVVDKRKHSETLMPMIDAFLKDIGIGVRDIDLFAVSGGPGSFTGLRIGMAAIKGMAFSTNKQIAVIKTPDVLANYYSTEGITVCPVIDARNNQVYTAVYKWKDSFYRPVTDYMGVKIEELADILKDYEKVQFCGDAAIKHYDYFKNNSINCSEPNPDELYPSAGVLVRLAAAGFGEIVSPSEAVPFYLRVSQAERFHGKS
ncbi:MAG: tRNA (adenosine(37)-N6)-threonylcarbamoyltransferase complex dimerization subunit type 1 TsaB [Clostridiales bacterium]|nr:tRNA (adenosine(37)-N6)-threonylcarbamoyltransferase complex dimerization subunit type 1 TsaB [Clostridiales bacterium]